MAKATSSTDLLTLVSDLQNRKQYQELNWTGTFSEYLEIVERNPLVTRTAFQRIYDMIMSYGTDEFIDAKKKLIRYRFFADPSINEDDAIFGLEIPLMRLVNFFRSAAEGYGTERRVLLLHGPVGSSQIHDRAASQKRARALLAHRRRRAVHVSLVSRRQHGYRRGPRRRGGLGRLPDARGAAAPGA